MPFVPKWRHKVWDYRREYNSWISMRLRCHDPKNIGFEHYGARGITVCQRWREDFDAFVDDMGLRPQGTTIDREDPEGNYEPGNCRWRTAEFQNRNKRTTPQRELNGEAKTLAEWARERGVGRETAALRIKDGVSLERALDSTPMRAPPEHGTLTRSTGRYSCKCDLCKSAKKEYDRKRYLAQKGQIFDL